MQRVRVAADVAAHPGALQDVDAAAEVVAVEDRRPYAGERGVAVAGRVQRERGARRRTGARRLGIAREWIGQRRYTRVHGDPGREGLAAGAADDVDAVRASGGAAAD